MPAWLAEQAGADGFVLATDIDQSWVDGVAPAGVEVRRHDVVQEDPAEGGFDLVHARLVLTHVPDRGEALRRMAAALRPGGHLPRGHRHRPAPHACPARRDAEHARAERIRAGFVALLVVRGVDRRFGRTLPASMRALGLTDVRADASSPLADPASAALEFANVQQVRDGLVAQGDATTEEIDAHVAALGDARLDLCVPPLVSASGRRP